MAETVSSPAIGPLTTLTEEERMFQSVAREFAEKEICPYVEMMDREGIFNHDLLTRFFDQGFMAIELPEAYGGSGGTFFMAILAIEEFSQPRGRPSLPGVARSPSCRYVLNTGRGGVRYMRLHLASCRSIRELTGTGTTFTGGQWIKFCSPSAAELDEWPVQYKGATSQRCGTCRPTAARPLPGDIMAASADHECPAQSVN